MWAKSLQSSATLCDPMDSSLPGSSLSIGFSRQEYRSGLPCPSPGDLPKPGIKPRFPAALLAESLLLSQWGRPLEVCNLFQVFGDFPDSLLKLISDRICCSLF